MSETSTTIRERVADAMRPMLTWKMSDGTIVAASEESIRDAADAAIAIIVEVYRNGQASLIEEERKDG